MTLTITSKGIVMPNRRKAVAVALLGWILLSALLLGWGMLSRPFFSSAECKAVLFVPAVIYGSSIGATIIFSTLRELRREYSPPSVKIRLVVFGLLPLVFGLMSFESIANFLPSIINSVIGSTYSRVYTVATVVHDSGSDRCNHITVKELKPYDSFRNLCVSKHAVDTLQPGDEIVLEGTQSWFGLNVARYQYQSAAHF